MAINSTLTFMPGKEPEGWAQPSNPSPAEVSPPKDYLQTTGPQVQQGRLDIDPGMKDFFDSMGLNPQQLTTLEHKLPPGTSFKELFPKMQNISGALRRNYGVYDEKEEGLQDFGIQSNGSKLFVAPEAVKDPKYTKAGENQLTALGTVLDQMGAFSNPEEAALFAKYTKSASDQNFISSLNENVKRGDKKSAVDSLLTQLGRPTITKMLMEDKASADDMATAFSAYNTFNDWDRLTDTQKSMAVSGIALKAYKFAAGEDISSKVLIGGTDKNSPSLTVGGALNMLSSGINVYALMKNWDQMDTMQRLTYGTGSAAQMASLAKQMNLLGTGASGTANAAVTAEQLGASGFKSTPAYGIGAITGKGAVPPGYTAIGQNQDGSYILAPEGTASTGSVFGATVQGLGSIAGALNAYNSFKEGDTIGGIGNTAVAGQQGINAYNAYTGASTVATAGSSAAGSAAGTGAGAGAGASAGASGAPAGASPALGAAGTALGALAGAYGAYQLGTQLMNSDLAYTDQAGRNAASGAAAGGAAGAGVGSIVPGFGTAIGAVVGAVIGGAAGAIQGWSGSSKGEMQRSRDDFRAFVKDNPEVTLFDENYQGTLADGTTFDFGEDTFDFGKGLDSNGDKKLDFEDPAVAEGAAMGNVIASALGFEGKGKEALAAQFLKAATSNAQPGDTGTVQQNMIHFMGGLGLDGQKTQSLLNKMIVDERIDPETYASSSAKLRDMVGAEALGETRQLASTEIDHIRFVEKNPGKEPPPQPIQDINAQKVYANWNKLDRRTDVNGAVGGTQMAAVLSKIGNDNPYLKSSIITTSVTGNLASNRTDPDTDLDLGKNQIFKKARTLNLLDETGKVKLADGSFAEAQGDLDYNNEVDMAAAVGATALVRVAFGGKGKQIDKLGNQIASATVGSMNSKELTPENFGKLQADLRSHWTKLGAKNKEDAYALVNVGFAEGRFTEMDHMAAQSGIDMAFDDNGYDVALAAIVGRSKGLAVAREIAKAPGPNYSFKKNKLSPFAEDEMDFDSGTYRGPAAAGNYDTALKNFNSEVTQVMNNEFAQVGNTDNMTRADIRKRNEQRYI